MMETQISPKTGLRQYTGRNGFARYRAQAVPLAQELLGRSKPGQFDEMALPAYTHPNLLMRWLFWRRLWHTIRFFDREVAPGARVLDFGCGVGMLLPLLADRGCVAAGSDIELRYTAPFLEHFGFEEVPLLGPE